MVPWLKPTSASADGGRLRRLSSASRNCFEHRRGLVGADPALVGIAEGQREPLPADRRLAAGLRRVRRDEGGVRQQALPGAADLDQVVAVGAIAVQEHDELARRSRTRLEPRTVEFSGHQALLLLGSSVAPAFDRSGVVGVAIDQHAVALLARRDNRSTAGAPRPPRQGRQGSASGPISLVVGRVFRCEQRAWPPPATRGRRPARCPHGRGRTGDRCRRSTGRCREPR